MSNWNYVESEEMTARNGVWALKDPEPDGVQIVTTPVCVDAHRVFGPEEMDERIRAIADRVEREEKLTPDDVKRRLTGRKGNCRRKT